MKKIRLKVDGGGGFHAIMYVDSYRLKRKHYNKISLLFIGFLNKKK